MLPLHGQQSCARKLAQIPLPCVMWLILKGFIQVAIGVYGWHVMGFNRN